MDAGEADPVLLVILSGDFAGLGAAEQSELGEKFAGLGELLCISGQCVEVVATGLVVGKLRLHVIVIEGLHDDADHFGGRGRLSHRGRCDKGCHQLIPSARRFRRRFASPFEEREAAASSKEFPV